MDAADEVLDCALEHGSKLKQLYFTSQAILPPGPGC